MERSNETKKSAATNRPDFFGDEDNQDRVQSRGNRSVREVQHNKRSYNNGSRSTGGSRSFEYPSFFEEASEPGDRRVRDRKKRDVPRHQSEHEITSTSFTFTLHDIRCALSDQILKDLLSDKYDRTHVVRITKQLVPTTFAEDELFTRIKPVKQRKRRQPTQVTPSAAFDQAYKTYKEGLNAGSAEAVLAVYFKLYLKLFGEEDPAWNGTDMQSALSIVKTFAMSITAGDYSIMIKFLKRILPLWKNQLVSGKPFPNTRPTLEQLFAGKRHFWSNRKIFYTKWQQPM